MTRYILYLLLLSALPLTGQEAQLPNLVMYIADDLGRTDVSLYGNREVRTPELEKLARRGLTFDRAFIASPSCAPSRGALLTALMPARNGAEANQTFPREDVHILTRVMQEQGYEVAAFGKVAHGRAKDYGYDYFEPKRDSLPERVRAYLAQRDSPKPLCLLVGDRRPHTPWTTDPIYTPEEVRLPPTFIDTRETREQWAQYTSDITGLDADMGRVFGLVEQHFGENYLFLFTADHGRPWPFGKWNLYDDGIRVPLVAVGPGRVAAGGRTAAMVSWIDIFPTFFDLAGLELPKVEGDLDGRSFLDVLEGADEHREVIYTTHSGDGERNVYPIRAVRTGRYKLIRNLLPGHYYSTNLDVARAPNGGGYWDSWDEAVLTDPLARAIMDAYQRRPPLELYDLELDPYERFNLIGEPAYAAVAAELEGLLDLWLEEQGDQLRVFDEPFPLSGPRPTLEVIRERDGKRK